MDYEDARVQSRKCFEVCKKHNKPVVVMEPVKGGSLVNLPVDANKILKALNGGSHASYALRFAASCKQVFMVLSGMSNLEQIQDNIHAMKDFQPLNESEYVAIEGVCAILRRRI